MTTETGVTRRAVTLEVVVDIEIAEGSDALTRVTGPGGDEWRSQFYGLFTEDDVLFMWADNAVRNGVWDASRLEGWGDLPEGEVRIVTIEVSP